MKHRYLLLFLGLFGCEEPGRLARGELGPWLIEPKPTHRAELATPVAVAEARPKRVSTRAPPPSFHADVPEAAPPPRVSDNELIAPPLRPRRVVTKPVERRATVLPRSPAVEVAATVGGGGLAVAAVGAAVALEDPNPGSLVLSGVGLGIGVVGLATAGVLALLDRDEEQRAVRVEPSGLGLTVRF